MCCGKALRIFLCRYLYELHKQHKHLSSKFSFVNFEQPVFFVIFNIDFLALQQWLLMDFNICFDRQTKGESSKFLNMPPAFFPTLQYVSLQKVIDNVQTIFILPCFTPLTTQPTLHHFIRYLIVLTITLYPACIKLHTIKLSIQTKEGFERYSLSYFDLAYQYVCTVRDTLNKY